MIKRIVLLTGSELRHEFFRKYIARARDIDVLATYCESKKENLETVVKNDGADSSFRLRHLAARAVTEYDFFGLYCQSVEDKSKPIFIEKGHINDAEHVENIIALKPDLIIAYGCSIIRSELLTEFEGRFFNVHLGLSPYYRGSGTNFWPFVNGELQFVGTTFMYIDRGVDTGEVAHQIRAKIHYNDNIHQIGNRLIRDSCAECVKLIKSSRELIKMSPVPFDKKKEHYYRKKDFTEKSLELAYENLAEGLVSNYLQQKAHLDDQFPIIENPAIARI